MTEQGGFQESLDLVEVCQLLTVDDVNPTVVYFATAAHENIRMLLGVLVKVAALLSGSAALQAVLSLLRRWYAQGTRLNPRRPDPFSIPDTMWLDFIPRLISAQRQGQTDLCPDLQERVLLAVSAIGALRKIDLLWRARSDIHAWRGLDVVPVGLPLGPAS